MEKQLLVLGVSEQHTWNSVKIPELFSQGTAISRKSRYLAS
jgi:hypothetical protein